MASPNTPKASTQEIWTTRRLLQWIEGHLAAKDVDSPRVCAQMLVSHVLQCERMRLYMEADRPASAEELAALRALVVRAVRHEPVQYLTGEAWFWSRRFQVGTSTLIPRPCTEHLVEHAVRAARAAADARGAAGEPRCASVLEIGTGTGCVAVCIAAALRGQRRGTDPDAGMPVAPPVDVRVVATDIVPAAVELAAVNAAAHGVGPQVELLTGDLYAPLEGRDLEGTFDVLVSNPPYVADSEWSALEPNVRDYEPRTALAGGPQGMNVLSPLIAAAHRWLRPGGLLVLEVGHAQHDLALEAARANPGLESAQMHRDFENFWRVLTAKRTP